MFETEKITRLAETVFRETGQLSISGHGILKRVFLSAYLSENGQRILPPREHFYFNRQPQIDIDIILVKKVAIYFIVSDPEANEMVRRWEQMMVQKAKIHGFRFTENGIFRFEEHLDFEAEQLYYYQYLPAVSYKPVGSNLHEYPLLNEKQIEPVLMQDVPSLRRTLVPALWVVLIALFGFAIYLWSGPLDRLLDDDPRINSRLVNVAPETYQPGDVKDFYNDTDNVKKNGHPNSNGTGEGSIHDSGTSSDRGDITIASEKENADLRSDISDRESETTFVPEESVEASPRCTLIVGAFANRDNVDRMVIRLQGYDVEVVTMERSTLTLVGANIPCSNSMKMNTLRDHIDSNAWIYNQ